MYIYKKFLAISIFIIGMLFAYNVSAALFYTVSTSAGTGGTISPSSRSVNYGGNTTFTVSPNSGYHTNSVTGCSGSLSGSTYTTGAITGNCTVTATFGINTYTITASSGANGTVTPTGTTTKNYGEKQTYIIAPLNSNYRINNVLIDNEIGVGAVSSYIFLDITANHSISATFALKTYTVTATAGSGGTISPASRTVNAGQATSFTVTPNSNYSIKSVTGTQSCGDGSLSGNIYTAGTGVNGISEDCTVTASFIINIPPSPTGFTATAVSQTQIDLSWTDNSTNESGFSVYLDALGDPVDKEPNQTSHQVGVSCNSGPWTFKVRAYVCGDGECFYSDWSNTASAATVCTPLSGSLSASSNFCEILSGDNGCNPDYSAPALYWDTTNPQGTSAITSDYPNWGATVAVGNSDGQVSWTENGNLSTEFFIPYGSRTFYLYNNGTWLDEITIDSSCTSGTVWDGDNACVPVVDGGWSDWSDWSDCSVTSCGQTGTQTHSRTCSNPYPANGGDDCVGSSFETQACSTASCLATATCSVSPDPLAYGGNPGITLYSTNAIYCQVLHDWNAVDEGYFDSGTYYPGAQTSPGTHQGEVYCWNSDWVTNTNWDNTCDYTVNDPVVDGGWSDWSDWSDCSVTSCGQTGTQTHSRTCSNPYPANGGDDCVGSSFETQACSTASCLATATCSVSPDPLAYGGNPGITLYSTNAIYCQVLHDWNAVDEGYFDSGTYYPGAQTSPGTHQGEVYCWNSDWVTNTNWDNTCDYTVNDQMLMSGTLTPASSSCTIVSGASSCNVNISWSTTNPQGTSAVTASGMTSVNGNSGNQAFAVPYNTRTFYLYNNAQLLDQDTVTSSCTSETAWDGITGKCEPFSPTVTISANPINISYNSSSNITWSSTNATSCSVTKAGVAWQSGTSGTNVSSGALTSNTTFVATCTGPGGNSAPASATVTVGAQLPTVTISANPTSVAYDGSSTLTWSSTNATSCSVTKAGVAWQSGTSGTNVSSGALTSNTTFVATCTGPGGNSAPASATVTVGAQPPIVSIFASPSSVDYNQSSTITWESTYATSCTASGDWSGAKAIGGPHSQSTGNLTSSKTYTLTCTGAGEDTSNSTTVTVGAPVMSGTLTPALPSCEIASGSNSCNIDFSWSITNPEEIPTAITAIGMPDVNVTSTLATPQSGNQSLPVPGASPNGNGSRTFYLYNNEKSLVPVSPSGVGVSVSSDCVSGTSWNGSICIVFSPTATLAASPGTIIIGDSSTLTWSSTNATSCTGTGFDTGGSINNNIGVPVSPLVTTNYLIVCTGPGGQATDQATVTVTTVDNVPIFKED